MVERAWEELLVANAKRKAASEQKIFLSREEDEQRGIAVSDHGLS